ncbi:MAG: MarR family transcriptional regulator [Clostridia bacterium]|nr:MarR family transcriptional regulator [Clostridia bacterium]
MREVEKLVREVNRLHFTTFHQTLSQFGLGKGQPPILKYLSENDGCKQSEIAQREHVSAATTTVMLQTMEKNGLIQRKSDENDLRIMRVYITDKGRQMQKKCDEAIENMEKEIYEGFTPDEIETFKMLLTKKRDRLKVLLEMEEKR